MIIILLFILFTILISILISLIFKKLKFTNLVISYLLSIILVVIFLSVISIESVFVIADWSSDKPSSELSISNHFLKIVSDNIKFVIVGFNILLQLLSNKIILGKSF